MSNRLFHGITVTHTDLEGKAERLNVTIYDSHFRLGVDAVEDDDDDLADTDAGKGAEFSQKIIV